VRYAIDFEGESAPELLHACDTVNEPGVRSDAGTTEAMKAYRQIILHDAQDRLIRFSDSLDTRRNRASLAAGRAEPARHIAVHQAFIRSDLLIVGKCRDSTLVDFVFGSVDRRVVSLGGCDVLVVFHDYQAPTGAAARGECNPCSGSDPAGCNSSEKNEMNLALKRWVLPFTHLISI
jgi:hypothetical protein